MAIADISQLFQGEQTTLKTVGKPAQELGMEDFMTLMVAQLENQDPTKPLENTDFLNQIAQFTTVSGIEELNGSFSDFSSNMLANQAVEAASLVGRRVMTESNVGVLESGQYLSGTIDFPQSSSSARVYIQDLSGRLVFQQELGQVAGGEFQFAWDGTDGNGGTVPAGRYRVSADAYMDGTRQGVSVYAHKTIESVTVGSGGRGVTMNLQGGGTATLSDVMGFL